MKTFVVLGMHRSATSLVANGLSKVIHFGDDFVAANVANPWGYFENRLFVLLNDKILVAAGGSWYQPPPAAAILAVRDQFDERIQKLVAFCGKNRDLWGWKDPRTTLTIKLYVPHLINPHFVACFRDQHEIAKSLQKREKKLSYDHCYYLAQEYNNRLLKFLMDYNNATTKETLA